MARFRRQERRSVIDRVRLSEFFVLMSTGMMLLALFLISSTRENIIIERSTVSAGFPSHISVTEVAKTPAPAPHRTELDFAPPSRKGRVPSRSIDAD